MNRRSLLAGLLALPFVTPIARAAAAVKRKLWPTIYVGAGQTHATLASALRDIEPGGTIFLLPGHVETINDAIEMFDVLAVVTGEGIIYQPELPPLE